MNPADWSIERALSHYNIPGWGAGFFSVNARGHMCLNPLGPSNGSGPGPTSVRASKNRRPRITERSSQELQSTARPTTPCLLLVPVSC